MNKMFETLKDVCADCANRLNKIDELSPNNYSVLPWSTWAEYWKAMDDLDALSDSCNEAIENVQLALAKYVGTMSSLRAKNAFIAMMNARDKVEQVNIDELPF